MRRSLLALLIAAAACGGSPKSTTPPPTLPDDKPAEPTKAEPIKTAETPKEPPIPQGPIDIPIPDHPVEVKLVSAGKGKKAKLVLSPKAGAKQSTELALDLKGGQDGPPETGGKVEQVSPTAVITADVETQAVSASGELTFQMTFSGIAIKDREGQQVSSADFKTQMDSLLGATLSGTVASNGQLKAAKLRIEKPTKLTIGGLQFLALSMLPIWPVLPTEAVGPGAKWTVTSAEKVMDKVDITKTVTYELVGKKGAIWSIKGTTAITGKDQTLQTENGPTTIGNIAGDGNHEVSLSDGVLIPTFKQNMATKFTISADISDPTATPGKPQVVVLKIYLDRGNTLTPKT